MNKLKFVTNYRGYLFAVIATAALIAGLSVFKGTPNTTAASTCPGSAQLSLSPASQSITTGANLSVNVIATQNTAGCSFNSVASTISYPTAQFNYVSFTGNSNPFGTFVATPGTGSVNFGAGSTTSLTGAQTVGTLVLQSKAAGSATISFSSICTGTASSTCSAIPDLTTTSQNDLGSVTGGNYTVSSPASTSGSTSGSSTSGSTSGSTSSGTISGGTSGSSSSTTKSSGSSSSTSSGSSSSSSTPSTTTSTPTTTSTSVGTAAPAISGVTVTNLSDSSATITWQTDIASSSTVNYGLTSSLGLVAQTAGMTTSHSVTLSSPNIVTGATYSFEAVSTGANGSTTTSAIQTFTTPGFGVTIEVLGTNGKPLSGAKVTVQNQTETTNASGVATFQNVSAGQQQVVVKDGNKSTKSSIQVGKYDPTTHTYAKQNFSLTAAKGTRSTTWILIAGLLVVVLVVAMLVAPLPPSFGGGGPLSRLLPPSLRPPVGMGPDGDALPIVVSGSSAGHSSGPDDTSHYIPPANQQPTAVVPPSSAQQPASNPSNPDHKTGPDPGSTITPTTPT